MEFHETNNSLDFLKILINFRIINTEDSEAIKLLENLNTNPNITETYVKNQIDEIGLSEEQLNKKINQKLNTGSNKQQKLKSVIKTCQKEDRDNPRKVRYYRQKNFLQNIECPEIESLMEKEKKINIVLDNYRVHHAKIVKKTCEILNINLIYLPPYSPDLNPIEDVWRVIKKELYNKFFNNLQPMQKVFEEVFYKNIDKPSFYENWVKKYISN